MATKRIFFNI